MSDEEIKRVIDPIESFHLQLKEEVESYEPLRRAQFDELENLRGLGRLLISIRIAQGISQREQYLQGLVFMQGRNMVEVYDRLYVGDGATCRFGSAQLAVVHACKSPCHQRAVGYTGSLPSIHPNYLALQNPYDLYLNIIDPPLPLFKMETFAHFLLFASQHHDSGGSLLIHCNQGESRAPTLALVFLAKHLNVIPGDTFSAAKEAFVILCEGYQPGVGIQQFLTKNWAMVGSRE